MHRIDTYGAVDGLFVRGNVPTATPPTLMGEEWPNAVQEELVSVILAAGLALDKSNNAQLLAAIRVLNSQRTRIGQYKEYAIAGAWDSDFEKPPEGQILLRADYPALWALVSHANNAARLAVDATDKTANPHKWGRGNGTTTFEMPDERGLFHRVHANGKPGSLAPPMGVFKANQNKAHTHDLPTDIAGILDIQSLMGSTNSDESATGALTGSSGGDEACPDHIATIYTIVLK